VKHLFKRVVKLNRSVAFFAVEVASSTRRSASSDESSNFSTRAARTVACSAVPKWPSARITSTSSTAVARRRRCSSSPATLADPPSGGSRVSNNLRKFVSTTQFYHATCTHSSTGRRSQAPAPAPRRARCLRSPAKPASRAQRAIAIKSTAIGLCPSAQRRRLFMINTVTGSRSSTTFPSASISNIAKPTPIIAITRSQSPSASLCRRSVWQKKQAYFVHLAYGKINPLD